MSVATQLAPVRVAPSLTIAGASSFGTNEISFGRYLIRLARTDEEIEAALRLRFEVFNLELGKGFPFSFRTGLDLDEFDSHSEHVILVERIQRRVIGTYRLRTYETAKTSQGFYLSREFDLSALPSEVLTNAIEVERTCIAKAHRNSRAHLALLVSLTQCLALHKKRYALGCLQLATQDPVEAGIIFDQASCNGHVHTEFRLKPKTGFKCLWYRMPETMRGESFVPGWLKVPLRFGARLCGPPAINREFRTIDFPFVLDLEEVKRKDAG